MSFKYQTLKDGTIVPYPIDTQLPIKKTKQNLPKSNLRINNEKENNQKEKTNKTED